MKALNSSLFFMCLTGIFLISCKKGTETAYVNENTSKLFARTIEVYDATHSNSAILRFRSSSKEVLERLSLENYEFTLVKTPVPVLDNLYSSSGSSFKGTASVSHKAVNQRANNIGELQLEKKAVYIDIASEIKAPSVSIDIRKKAIKKTNTAIDRPLEETLWVDDPNAPLRFFISSSGYHRVQIENLAPDPIDVSFYYDSCDDETCRWRSDGQGTINEYSGYSYTLYLGGWAWYYHCSRTVGALVEIPPNTYYSFRWTLWTNCMP